MTGGGKSANGSGMKSFLIALYAAILFLPVGAAGAVPVRDIVVCPVSAAQPPVRFDGPGCAPSSLADLNPQGRDIWVRMHADVPADLLTRGPLGLYVSAKASSEAWVNGVHVGRNGTVAASRAGEAPGRMDTALYIPQGVLRAGENDVVFRMSSFHNVVQLSRPVHMITIAPFADPVDVILRAYWPSLVTFGVLLAGGFFFASSALSAVNRRDPLLLALLSLLAAGQLFAEVYRGLAPYAYPVQDWRLIAIAGFATVFAMGLATLIVLRFATWRPMAVLGGIVALTLVPLVALPGFDGKAVFALLVATAASAAVAGQAALKGDRSALWACAGLVVFAGSMLLFQARFLDAVFYYEVAALILVLFVVRTLRFERERREHETMRLRAHDLELALARATQTQTPAVIRIASAGAVTIVNTVDITLCKGADDYVELHLADGRTILHNGALADLETELPGSFLRVHRSFIVNTAFVGKLTRETSGVGVLTLSNGAQAPVSRRIMPKVREALI